ncbi:VTT domain-containing protein [archaeon]|nr:VTT domain-containing protein [archaeon]
MNQELSTDTIFSYNLSRKRWFVASSIIIIALIIAAAITYFLFLKGTDIAGVKTFEAISKHILWNVKHTTLLGALYTSLIGGLFFIFMPIEAVFIAFIRSDSNPAVIIMTFICGFIFSYTLNYFIGMKLSNTTRRIIGPKRFFKIKIMLNKYGAGGVFLINVIPILPSQTLAAILGVFKYNKTKFYIFFLTGQITKYILITIAYLYIV